MLRTFTPLLLHFANPLLYTNRIIAIICDRNNRNEQARILFQMALSFESREELDTHAIFQSLVEQAAKFTPRMLYFFGFAFDGNNSNQTFELYSLAYSRAEKHHRSWMNDIASGLDQILYEQEKLAESEVFCRKMVSEFTEEHGGEHECTLDWLPSLSISLRLQDKYREARALARRV
jgi:hypothetical protein